MKIIATDLEMLIILFYSGKFPKAAFVFYNQSKFILQIKTDKLLCRMT